MRARHVCLVIVRNRAKLSELVNNIREDMNMENIRNNASPQDHP